MMNTEKRDMKWKNNKLNGIGIEYYENGALRYRGMMINNERNGYGTYYEKNGKVFLQGEFRNGRQEGYGIICDEGGRILYQGLIDIKKMGLA